MEHIRETVNCTCPSILHRIIILLFTFPPSLWKTCFNFQWLSVIVSNIYSTLQFKLRCTIAHRLNIRLFLSFFFFLHHVFIIFAAKGVLRVIIIKKCNIYIYIIFDIFVTSWNLFFVSHIFGRNRYAACTSQKYSSLCGWMSRKLETDTFLIRNRVLKIYLSLRSARKIN